MHSSKKYALVQPKTSLGEDPTTNCLQDLVGDIERCPGEHWGAADSVVPGRVPARTSLLDEIQEANSLPERAGGLSAHIIRDDTRKKRLRYPGELRGSELSMP